MLKASDSSIKVQEFRYPLSGMSAPRGWQSLIPLGTPNVVGESSSASTEQQHSSPDELSQAFEEGRRKGIDEGRRMEQLEHSASAEQLDKERMHHAAKLTAQFAAEHQKFLNKIEPEVVNLALRIAGRILRREAEVDPLVLTGAVRVALGQLADKTAVRMRVPAADADLWRETFAHLPNLCIKPAIVADDTLQQGECELESDCGFADLSIEGQLREIARTFAGNTLQAPEEIESSDSSPEELYELNP